MNGIELLKLAILVVGIGWCLKRELHHPLMCFIGFSLGTDLIVVDFGPSASGLQILGLLHLAYLPKSFRSVLGTWGGKALLLSLLLLLVLVFVYGYLLPWPDRTGERPWAQRSEGRSIVNFGATLSFISTAFYVAARIKAAEYRRRLIDYLLIGTTFASLGVLLEVVLRVDLFALLSTTGAESALSDVGRARGFNGEPRAAGSVSALGLVMLLRPGWRVNWRATLMLLLHALAIVFTTSTLGLILFVMGTVFLFSLTRRLDMIVVLGVVGGVTFMGISAWFGNTPLEVWREYAGERFYRREAAIDTNTPLDSLVQSLEVFDASALNFFRHHPEHLVVGTGPGLVSLPASSYVPAGPAQDIFGDRIDSIPFMGLLRLIADSGLIGLGLWFATTLGLTAALSKCIEQDPKDTSWRDCRTYFLVFSLLFLLQTRSIWYVWLGVGLGAAMCVQEERERVLREFKAKRRSALLTRRVVAPRAVGL